MFPHPSPLSYSRYALKEKKNRNEKKRKRDERIGEEKKREEKNLSFIKFAQVDTHSFIHTGAK